MQLKPDRIGDWKWRIVVGSVALVFLVVGAFAAKSCIRSFVITADEQRLIGVWMTPEGSAATSGVAFLKSHKVVVVTSQGKETGSFTASNGVIQFEFSSGNRRSVPYEWRPDGNVEIGGTVYVREE